MRDGIVELVGVAFLDVVEVVGAEEQLLFDLADLAVEVPLLHLVDVLVLELNAELPAIDEHLLQLLVLDYHEVDLTEHLQTDLNAGHLIVPRKGDLYLLDRCLGLVELEVPHLLQQLQVQPVALFVDSDIAVVLNPLEEAVPFQRDIFYLLKEQATGSIRDQLAVKLLSQNILEV